MTPSCLSCASLDKVFMEIIPCRPQHAVEDSLIFTGTRSFSDSGQSLLHTHASERGGACCERCEILVRLGEHYYERHSEELTEVPVVEGGSLSTL